MFACIGLLFLGMSDTDKNLKKQTMSLFTIITCVLLPPLAVFMKTGLSGKLLINILLSILGWVPGVIHALYVSR